MSEQTERHRDYGFVVGLGAGTIVGAALAIWLAPRAASELGTRVTESARHVGAGAARQYRNASARVGAAVGEVTEAGQDVRDGLADAVVRGAQAVERQATATKSDRASRAGSDGRTGRTDRAPDAG